MMADGSKTTVVSASSNSGSLKHCSVCGVAVKDHLGPHGPAKCLVKLVESFSQRVEQLELLSKRQADELQLQGKLHVERQEALLATIEDLEERVASLEAKVVALERAKVEVAVPSCPQESVLQATNGADGARPPSTDFNSVSEVTNGADGVRSPNTDHNSVSVPSATHPAASRATTLAVFATSADGEAVVNESIAASSLTLEAEDNSVFRSESAMTVGCAAGGANSAAKDKRCAAGGANSDSETKDMPTTWADAVVETTSASPEVSDVFQEVGRNGRPVRGKARRERGSGSSCLKGAVRIHCLPFHLSGISLDSCADDIISYCRKRNVPVTGCYLIRSRVWGTQSAKIYVDKEAKERVVADGFWPTFLRCRIWEAEAPKSKRSLSAPLQ